MQRHGGAGKRTGERKRGRGGCEVMRTTKRRRRRRRRRRRQRASDQSADS
jgi:hypothetical protein